MCVCVCVCVCMCYKIIYYINQYNITRVLSYTKHSMIYKKKTKEDISVRTLFSKGESYDAERKQGTERQTDRLNTDSTINNPVINDCIMLIYIYIYIYMCVRARVCF